MHDDLAAEVREAVYAGAGLIVDGAHDQRNKVIDAALGVDYRGKYGATDLNISITAGVFVAQTLPTVNRALRLEPANETPASIQARFDANAGLAIATNNYGNGKVVLFAFDLVSSLRSAPAWQSVLGTALDHIRPPLSDQILPGAQSQISTSINNIGPATAVQVKSVLPEGATVLSTGPATAPMAIIDGNTVIWNLNLALEQRQEVRLSIRWPAIAGQYSLQTEVATVQDGIVNPYGTPLQLTVKVISGEQISQEVTAALQALNLSTNVQKKQRDAILAKVQSAMLNFSLKTTAGYENAIGQLVQAIDILARLSGLTGANDVQIGTVQIRAIHDGLDKILSEAQWRWSQSLPL